MLGVRCLSGALGLIFWLGAAKTSPAQPARPGGDELHAVLAALAERTQQYYDRFISIICTETSHQQDLRLNLAPSGRPRVTVFELSVIRDERASTAAEDFRVERTLLSVNGRKARSNQEPYCTDPKTGTPEPLAFLLARNQGRFRWWLSSHAEGGPNGARALDFVEAPPQRVNITWKGNCFEANGGDQTGRVWFDPVTYDILQVDSRLAQPIYVPIPSGLGLIPAIRVERSEVSVRFSRVTFDNPDEVVLLPESIETLTVFRGAPSLRTRQVLSNFRRFLSEAIIR